MSRNQKNQSLSEAQSPLSVVPHPNQILDRINRNIEEGRILRSLYKIARKAEQQREREPANA